MANTTPQDSNPSLVRRSYGAFSDGQVYQIVGGDPATNNGAIPVIVTEPASSVTPVTGQAAIATSNTAVAISTTNYVLQNGIVVAANSTNAAAVTLGFSSGLTSALTGGNGFVLVPGQATGVPSGTNINSIFINGGTVADGISFEGN